MTASNYAPEGFEVTLSKRWHQADGHTWHAYRADGGYEGLAAALALEPDEVIDAVKKCNLRGRGGAGFPAGVKWGFVPERSDKPKYLVVNGDESEPGTYKDRYILARDPHMLIEGAAIAAYAIGAHTIFFYLRGEFGLPRRRLEAAIAEAYEHGILGATVLGKRFELDAVVHRGAGAYICGEETALLESLEGKIGRPRLKPPFPALVGAFGCPTIVHNVETLSCVPLIFARGVDWFNSVGSPANGGPKLVCVSGHVERPGVYEVPNGYPCDQLIELAGGVWKGRALKAIIPGGSSTVPLVPRPCEALAADGEPREKWPLETSVNLDIESVARAGSMFGSAGLMVLDETTCMVRTLAILGSFYAHESCGQCTPCREGTGWIAKMLWRLENGDGTHVDLGTLRSASSYMMGTTICPLADAFATPVQSYLAKFEDEFVGHVERGACWFSAFEVAPHGDPTWEDTPHD